MKEGDEYSTKLRKKDGSSLYNCSQLITHRHDQTDSHYKKEDLNLFCWPNFLDEVANTIDFDTDACDESTHLLLMLSKRKYRDDAIDQ